MTQTILLRLADNGKPMPNRAVQNGVLILPSVPKGRKKGEALFNLVVRIDAGSLITNNGKLLVNVPESSEDAFDRHSYREYSLDSSFHQDISITIPIYNPGPYSYFIKYHVGEEEKSSDLFFFNVPPQLMVGKRHIQFNSINVQTVISKWAGLLNKWPALFSYIAKKGYNMVHFTPLQQRGSSNSPYSIFDQLKFDPSLFKSNDQAAEFISGLMNKHSLLSLTDVVWNHTANNSDWIRQHPDIGYNLETAPHLRPAIELDEALSKFSDRFADLGLPTEIKSERDLSLVLGALNEHVIDPLKLWQFYVFDKERTLNEINKLGMSVKPAEIPPSVDQSNLLELSQFVLKSANKNQKPIISDRFANKLDAEKVLAILLSVVGSDSEKILQKASTVIDEINSELYKEYDNDVQSIKKQVEDRARFMRLADNGPKLGLITSENRFTESYFTRFADENGKSWALANNGWIWGGNPLVDFASDKSKAYLRREVIVWADCVKLRYGESSNDSPYLWKRMTEYTKQCAKVFNGFRLDNCHSTPLHVGESLLAAARSVNPNLYVVAELFTGSESMDKIFVERLGINSLIREAMQAGSVDELSRLVHKHGGRPIGSFSWLPLDDVAYPAEKEPISGKFSQSNSELEIPKILTYQAPHALFMDCTHDNQTPAQIRTVEDTLPTAALVSFCSSAVGTVFGYDETYPELLDVVGEKRQYKFDENCGIALAKQKLNAIRDSLSCESDDSFNDQEMYIHHEGQYITIQRYNTVTGRGWFLIARSHFEENPNGQVLTPVELKGTEVKPEFAYVLEKTGNYTNNSNYLTGIPTKLVAVDSPRLDSNGADTFIKIDDSFKAGSIAVFSTRIPAADASLDKFVKEGALQASLNLNLYDLNAILFRSEPEERDASGGADGTYNIPQHGNLVYAGLEGWISVLKHVIWENDLGHPVCDHLRSGLWAADNIVDRLDKYSQSSESLRHFQLWLRSRTEAIKEVPYFLRPHYFALVVGVAYEAARFRALRLLDDNIKASTNFVQSLALTSVQMCGLMNNTSLFPNEQKACLAAGLPHFSNDYMRCWGRDVFISFRGLLIVPGRFNDAREHILGFAKTLKHGLIPNLLDAGRNPRYNARDAVWFFAQAVQEYVTFVPNGHKILDEKVSRRFPLDDTWIPWDHEEAFSHETSIRDVLFEILSRHAKGIRYREANAGPNLDSQMSDEGFNVLIHVDWSTGLVHGGSQYNCGTWMDKMGESVKAGSRGVPGTPRDGAAVELQGLLKSTLRFVNTLNKKGLFDYTSVEKEDGSKITLKDWEQLLQDNFERCFYIPEDPAEDSKFEINSVVVNRRGIYKDLFHSGKEYEDYQLRANFPIAMCVAPELFTEGRAKNAINIADKYIRGPVGMRTLDPSDWNYRPYYNNGEDSDDFATSKGRNYHQGPEWVWCFGYFIRAFLYFNHVAENEGKPSSEVLQAVNLRLRGHKKWIRESEWAGLTELTNKDGELCKDSSPTQAWSTSCLLDLYYDLWNLHVYNAEEGKK
ncbi:glycogen debranching enzyme [Metschnikowia bicuspidata var. bicuspidata NRRL YB-4993]|uniref:Glycogen debranching enzyme n=1 Tax=Metschnikowia bicuspidata var. bicuspidata NRRL YB-4993 TaxID=869754 RepID=A0A1A0HHF2_9ASCO|nr:glycogen debranching enzyme [Metschnikowia bicuspidata var. bicuspidata NRRL YB-4993]OBA23430.1 glycogen debranching enzyme [Metschnikowia bicuspidata var. bicuspidata NRRL YB-4993]